MENACGTDLAGQQQNWEIFSTGLVIFFIKVGAFFVKFGNDSHQIWQTFYAIR